MRNLFEIVLNKFKTITKRINSLRTHFENLGASGTIVYNIQHLRDSLFHIRHPFKLISRFSQYPLICRPNSSDISVFYQIFVLREYACLDEIRNPDLIIDCGANVGYSSAYFLSKYPFAKLIAIEPDPDNFIVLKKNLSQYGKRVKLLNSAIWSQSIELSYDKSTLGARQEWARQLHETKSDELNDIKAIDIGSVLLESGHDSISILKIDIEGAEKAVFSLNYETWLPYVENLVIELHGSTAKKIFSKVITDTNFNCTQSGELTCCTRKNSLTGQ